MSNLSFWKLPSNATSKLLALINWLYHCLVPACGACSMLLRSQTNLNLTFCYLKGGIFSPSFVAFCVTNIVKFKAYWN